MVDRRQNPPDNGTGVKLDLTVNIPTLLAILSMVAGSITYVNAQITSVSNQQLNSAGDIRLLQAQMSDTQTSVASLRADTATQLNLFRSEIRGDLRDLKTGVDNLRYERPPTNKG